jgi:hypothetical protein
MREIVAASADVVLAVSSVMVDLNLASAGVNAAAGDREYPNHCASEFSHGNEYDFLGGELSVDKRVPFHRFVPLIHGIFKDWCDHRFCPEVLDNSGRS